MQLVPQSLGDRPGGLMRKPQITGTPETQAQPQLCKLDQVLHLGKLQFPQG